MSKPSLAQVEESFIESRRPKGNMTKRLRAMRGITTKSTVEFFRSMVISDADEAELWRMFITGKALQLDDHGRAVINPATNTPYLVDVEPNPVSLAAFKQAVAYKRGQPQVTVKAEGEDGQVRAIEINIIGATPQYFEKAAKERGLLKEHS